MTEDGPPPARVDDAADKADQADEADTASDAGSDSLDMFADPPGYYPPSPPPTTEQHALGRSGVQLTLHLVGHSVLEAHRLWNGSRVMADYFEDQEAGGAHIVQGKTVLELGAGAGLPGIVCGLVLGARKVVVTDYPDADLVATMRRNIDEAERGLPGGDVNNSNNKKAGVVVADGLVWGGDPTHILAHLDGLDGEDPPSSARFDVVLLADLLFRHAEHAKLATSVAQTLKCAPASRAYVFFTSYRPWLRHKDLAFFGDACAAGLVVEHLLERRLEKPPLFFENDPGDAAVRSTVSGYSLRWPVEGEDPATFWPGAEGGSTEPETAAVP